MVKMKSIAKAILPRKAYESLKRIKHLIAGESWPPAPFDNRYPWLNYAFSDLCRLTKGAFPQYAWGVTQGAALAKVLGFRESQLLNLEWLAGMAF